MLCRPQFTRAIPESRVSLLFSKSDAVTGGGMWFLLTDLKIFDWACGDWKPWPSTIRHATVTDPLPLGEQLFLRLIWSQDVCRIPVITVRFYPARPVN